MTTKITVTNDDSEYAVRVRKFGTAMNGERYEEGEPTELQPGETHEEWIHSSAMVEVTEGPPVEGGAS